MVPAYVDNSCFTKNMSGVRKPGLNHSLRRNSMDVPIIEMMLDYLAAGTLNRSRSNDHLHDLRLTSTSWHLEALGPIKINSRSVTGMLCEYMYHIVYC